MNPTFTFLRVSVRAFACILKGEINGSKTPLNNAALEFDTTLSSINDRLNDVCRPTGDAAERALRGRPAAGARRPGRGLRRRLSAAASRTAAAGGAGAGAGPGPGGHLPAVVPRRIALRRALPLWNCVGAGAACAAPSPLSRIKRTTLVLTSISCGGGNWGRNKGTEHI